MMHFIDKPGKELEQSLTWLDEEQVYAIDTETSGLDPHVDKVLLLQIGNAQIQWVYDTYRIRNHIQPVLDYLINENKIKVLHNAQFDYKMLLGHYGIKLNNIKCTMLAEQLLTKGKVNIISDSEGKVTKKKISASLAAVTKKYLNINLDKEERSTFIDMNWGQHFTKTQIEYAGSDVIHLIEILQAQTKLLKERNMEQLAELEFKAATVFGDISYRGIYLDSKPWKSLEQVAQKNADGYLNKLNSHFEEFINFKSTEDLFGKIEYKINYNSPKQVLPLLQKITKSNITNTDAKYLEDFKNLHPVIEDLLNYKKELKKINTYGASFLEYIHPITKRIHSNFKQIYADTGRTSSEDPNMQNLPKQQEYRTPFCVEDPVNWQFISADFSGQELRILAQLSGDTNFIEAIKDGKDLHSYSASLLFGIPYEEFFIYDETGKMLLNEAGEPIIKPEMKKKYRNPCKTITFGLLYGAGPNKIASSLKITKEEAKELMDKYFKTFPDIKKLMVQLTNNAKKSKCAISPLDGRQIDLAAIDWDNNGIMAHALNQAKNLPFQGCGASITKLALCYINDKLKKYDNKAYIVNVIHDEILVECKKEIVNDVKIIVETEMIKAFNFYCPDVKMTVVAEVGTHWVH